MKIDPLGLKGALNSGHGLSGARKFATGGFHSFYRGQPNGGKLRQFLLANAQQDACRAYLHGIDHDLKAQL